MSEKKGAKAGAAAAPGQSHLPPTPTPVQDESARIDKLVSLTYDSNPEVRHRAAKELAIIDDPRAVFALLELGADKDPAVQELARSSLDHFKGEEKETLISLEKIFEARQEGKPISEDMVAVKQKLMPSLEKYFFSKNKAVRDRLMPSLEKFFNWTPSATSVNAGHEQSHAPAQPSQSTPASSTPHSHRSSFEQVATAHLSDEEANPRVVVQPIEPEHSSINDEDNDEGPSMSVPASVPIAHPSRDPLSGVENIRSHKSLLEQAEADVGVPAHLRSSHELHRLRKGESQQGHIASGSQQAASQFSSSSMQQRMDEATNFPVPEYLQPKAPSPTSAIPSMTEEKVEEVEMEEGVRMPKHALYYYKLAYAIAMTPGIKASEVKKEKERLVKESKQDIELAFKLALERTATEGIESLSGLKPGMKKLSTLPLEVLDNVVVSVPHGKKLLAYNRILLSDGKHQLPLYVPPPRADGIRSGDLLSLRDAFVDYWIKSNPTPGSSPGELVLMLGKNGQLIVNK